jgi:hypothetical protein
VAQVNGSTQDNDATDGGVRETGNLRDDVALLARQLAKLIRDLDLRFDGVRSDADVALLARQLAKLIRDLDLRFDGVRSDADVALLQQVAKLERRCERMEALVAAALSDDLDRKAAVLAELG